MTEQWAIIKAALVALVVAVLIWVWAEGESLTSRQTDPIQVIFPVEASNDLVIRPIDPKWKGTVRIRLEGAVRVLDRAAGQLGREIRLTPELEGMPRAPVDRVDIDLEKVIRGLPALAGASGAVAEVEPAKVTVTVVKMVTRSLPVRVDFARPLALDGTPVTTPATVDIRLPEPVAAVLPLDAQAVATIGAAEIARIKSDGPQVLSAVVRPPDAALIAPEVVVTPDTVSVSFRIRQSIDTVKLPTVPVWYSLPPTEDGSKWNIEILDKFLTDVVINGPSNDVQRIRSGQTAVKAMIEFTSDELERASADKAGVTRQVSFPGLPAGLSAVVANPTVRVKVTKRAANGGAGSAAPPIGEPADSGSGRLLPAIP